MVNYNPDNFLGIRILTIPVEDAVYGYEMILWNIFLFKKFKIDENN
ncbi:lycopene cyclase domain-containing protein [Chryseobacterium indoltheticum]